MPSAPASIPLFQAPGTPGAFKYRQFRIQKKGDSFVLEGWDREFPTLRELLDVLKGCTLKSGEENFTVKRCCPPKPGGEDRDHPSGSGTAGISRIFAALISQDSLGEVKESSLLSWDSQGWREPWDSHWE